MTSDSKKRKGTFGRVIDAIMAWAKAMEYTPYDYALDRVGGFRREVQPVDSIGSSTESRVSHSKRRLLLGFEGTKTARREGISSTFSDARGCTSRRNSSVCDLERQLSQLRDELRALPAGNSAGGHVKPTSSSPTGAR